MPEAQIVYCFTDIRLVHIATPSPITGDAFCLNRKVDLAYKIYRQQEQISQMPGTANTVITTHTKCCAQMAELGQIADLNSTTD